MFSVIIPVYNKADSLKEAIVSVLEQTCAEWELIIVDDGSTDDFCRAVSPYSMDSRITIIHQENRGVSAARNQGIEIAKEPYLAFLDADDEWLPDHLDKLRTMILESPGAGIYVTAYRTLLPSGEIRDNNSYFLSQGIFRTTDLFEYMERFGGKAFINTVSSCVSVEAITCCGVFQNGVCRGEDTDFFFRIAAYFDVVLLDKVTAIYHRERSTATKNGLFQYDWFFLNRELSLLNDKSIPNEKRLNIKLFINRYRLHQCRHYLMDGNRKEAYKVFSETNNDPRIRTTRFITLCMIFVPSSLLRSIYSKKKT